jgi:hypothetical protein
MVHLTFFDIGMQLVVRWTFLDLRQRRVEILLLTQGPRERCGYLLDLIVLDVLAVVVRRG